MSTLIAPLSFEEELRLKLFQAPKYSNCIIRNKCRHVLKSKCRFTSKCYKCVRTLKCKLRKYKIRRNGEEDPDVVDVSHILLSSLKLKSPNKLLKSPEIVNDRDLLRPKNYLFKMARRKLKTKSESLEVTVKEKKNSASSPLAESQEKKQTNAFKLLMDSRNKSIGSNSPGKEKNVDPSELQEVIEKKSVKVKRNLALQKLAEAKGALKKRELDDMQEMCIQQKMEERAERLKNMLVNAKPKVTKPTKAPKKSIQKKVDEVLEVNDSSNSNDAKEKKYTLKEPKTLRLIDIFKEVVKPNKNISPEKKLIPQEDEEFLSKLSPSIRKKENMLSYFKKIEKRSPDAEEVVEETETVIKVKIAHKKKIKKKRLSLSKNMVNDVLKDHNENSSCEIDVKLSNDIDRVADERVENKERKKRKRKENSTDVECKSEVTKSLELNGRRPKRNVKRPVKYNEDVQLTSSDEELHVFTSKKRRNCENKTKNATEIISSDDETEKIVSKSKKITNQEKDKSQKKLTKLAPIFTPKPQLNPEQLEARQRFLYSGVPDQIKKIIVQQQSQSTEVTNEFPVVVHIQQLRDCSVQNNNDAFPFQNDYTSDEEILHGNAMDLFRKFTQMKKTTIITSIPQPKSNANAVLQTIKEQYPKFPVYRTYRLLKDKSKGENKDHISLDLENSIEVIDGINDLTNESPACLNWANKYKASSTKCLLGNFESIKGLKKWLQSWIENETRSKNTPSNDSDSSDFCYDTDSNSKDCFKSMNNLLILNGPVGSGKTTSVYAVASELAIKVIEVNASSKRTGKVMLQDLQEATQSHKVNRGCLENSQKSQESTPIPVVNAKKKKGRPKKAIEVSLKTSNSRDEILNQHSLNQENGRTGMSLILVDDADIVFDQDDGFSSAISQITQCSKRPVILVTSTLSCPHLQRFVQYGKIIKINPLPPRILGTWLDIMCLADSGTCWPGLGARFLDYFKGDIRKSINYLQFYTTSLLHNEDEAKSQNSNQLLNPEDESSNMSWMNSECSEEKHSDHQLRDEVWKCFMNRQTNLTHMKYPSDLINVWWSVPRLLNLEDTNLPDSPASLDTNSKERIILELDSISKALDTISLADYYTSNDPDTRCNITSQPWYSTETDSVNENECYINYSKLDDTTNEIVQELVTGSIITAQKVINKCEGSMAVTYPGMAAQRAKDKIVTRLDSLTDILNQSAALDRKALALDYWSACRTICRIEKNRTDTVLKRNNRFCHYLKSLNTVGGSSMFDSLANSLSSRNNEDEE